VDKLLKQEAVKLNKKCPVMVDDITRWDSTETFPGHVLQYDYTISVDRSQVDLKQAEQRLGEHILANVRTNPDMKTLREQKVIFVYDYRDPNGIDLVKIRITPEQYKEK